MQTQTEAIDRVADAIFSVARRLQPNGATSVHKKPIILDSGALLSPESILAVTPAAGDREGQFIVWLSCGPQLFISAHERSRIAEYLAS